VSTLCPFFFYGTELSPAQAQATSFVPKESQGYKSPYQITLPFDLSKLRAIDQLYPRNDSRLEANCDYAQWYTEATLRKYGSWGPRPRHYPLLPDFTKTSLQFKQARLLAVALKYIGLPYQHHHIPSFNPPKSWPWKEVDLGYNSPGLDCSNFTSWIYNYALGLKIVSKVDEQANLTSALIADNQGEIPIQWIGHPGNFRDLGESLQPADLLYIRNRNEKINHVIIWTSQKTKDGAATPLIIDCTNQDRQDSNGNTIPKGVQIRPFSENTWYFKNFDHALRILQ
jgi:cell wall-associated NlpC family hydrolase